MDYSWPGSSAHGILQARILERVAIFFSRGSSWLRDWTQVCSIAGRCFNLWATREAHIHTYVLYGLLGGSAGKESACNARDSGSIPRSEDPLEKGIASYPLWYSCLKNSMERRAWWATVHRVAKSDTTEHLTHIYIHMYIDIYVDVYVCT